MSSQRYRFLEHTADAKFQAFGKTLEEAFSNAALAMASLMWDWKIIKKESRRSIEVEGKDLKQLLVAFLEEILFLWDVQGYLLGGIEDLIIMKKEKTFNLNAVLLGDTNKGNYAASGDVKAITYNEMEVLEKNGFQIQVVVDI